MANQGTLMRKRELEEIKKTLKQQKVLLLRADENLEKDLKADAENRHGDDVDLAEADTERELAFQLKTRGQSEIKRISEALGRIESGEYGDCAECGESIPIKRLKALPFSIHCVECQEEMESSRNMQRHE